MAHSLRVGHAARTQRCVTDESSAKDGLYIYMRSYYA